MSLPIHTYCLTVPYSDRHIRMQEQLKKKCKTFEFVFNNTTNVLPLLDHVRKTPYWKSVVTKFGKVDTKVLDAVERAWKCKAGMVQAMQKIADDNRGWSLFVQDDVILLDDWLDRAESLIRNAPAHMDRITVTRVSDIFRRNAIHVNNSSYCTETAMLLTPEFARRYIRANGMAHVESDLAPIIVDGIGNILFNNTFAILACTESTIANE